MNTYGQLQYLSEVKAWEISGRSRMLLRLKRMFEKPVRAGSLVIDATPMNAEDIEWFLQRYPMEISDEDRARLEESASLSRRGRANVRMIRENGAASMSLMTLYPLREYQKTGVAVLMERESLLCGDDLGLGKTVVAVGAHQKIGGPTIVVCQTHLQAQWKMEMEKFLFGVEVHIVKKIKNYDLPIHDVLIIPYSKLAGWADYIVDSNAYQLVVYDEAQELRREESMKYGAAKYISDNTRYRLGLTATPIYNYGDEIFNVLECIDAGVLGCREEFLREYCRFWGRHYVVEDPVLLHEELSEEIGVFLRRRRCDVGRELPDVQRVTEFIGYDKEKWEERADVRSKLAEKILSSHTKFEEKGESSRQLDLEIRRSTGIAKADEVAQFVIDQVEAGEKVVLAGWHRSVYDIWLDRFDQHPKTRAVLYTGSESATQKQRAVDSFVKEDSNIFIMSLRSGAGLNGLQMVSSLIVFGELDWSPQVHDQLIGRLNRDGQQNPVTAVFLVCEEGSDPVMASVLGIKREQSLGVTDGEASSSLETSDDLAKKGRGKVLAESVMGLSR